MRCQPGGAQATPTNTYTMTAEVDLLDADEELGGGAAQRRDWRGIGTALLVIFIICLLIFLCGYIFTPLGFSDPTSNKHTVNLTELKKFRPANNVPDWLKDGRLFYDNDDGTHIMSFENGSSSLVVSYKEIHDLLQRGASVQCSFDCSQVSLSYTAENPGVNPENETSNVHVLDLKSRSLHRVSKSSEQPEPIRYIQWAPTGNDFIFAQGGHLYYVKKAGDTPVAISQGKGKLHGVFDWVTDEEIFGTRQAAWWSKDGNTIAFASKEVPEDPAITITAYREAHKYQIDTKLVYPKTGEKRLPVWTLSVWDKASGTTKQMDVQLRDSSAFHYLFGVSWVRMGNREVLAAVWANRWQNQTSLTLCNFETGICSLSYEHMYPSRTWALPDEYKGLIGAQDSIFLILPRQATNGNSYQHIARVKTQGGNKQFLSMGNFDVKSINFHDEANDLLYFTTMAPRPTNQHLYVTKASVSSVDAFRCVTCSLPNCSYASATFSSDGKHLSLVCRGLGIPRFYLADLSKDAELERVREVLHDSRLEQMVASANLPEIIQDEITLENGIVASTKLMKPRTNKLSSALPLLVYVYGGPNYQLVDDTFSVNFMDYLVTNLNIAVLKIDATGTGSRGWKYRSPIYGALGTAEMVDQIEATHLILKKYPYLDPSRVAIHGWSYGGFATLRIVQTAPKGMFKCAISGAPVTNFQYYDATYTERYMGAAPREAYTNLNEGDMSKFKSTRLLLIHGLADDNVHFQNSAVFSEAMQINQVDFDFMVYSNERHHLSGEKWMHGYTTMTSFLRECLTK